MITTEQIQKIREATGLGIMDIRNALEAAGGDEAQAMEALRERAGALAEKRADRATGQGRIGSYIHSNNKTGVMLEVQCETDFVADNEDFVAFVKGLSMHIAGMKPADVSELLEQAYLMDSEKTISELHKELIAKTGENIVIKRFVVYTLGEE